MKLPTDPSGDEPIFHISHIDRVYTIRAESINERWEARARHTHTCAFTFTGLSHTPLLRTL